MHTKGRTYLLTVGSGGSVQIPPQPGRMSLRIGPTTAEAWQLAFGTAPDTTHGMAYASTDPIAYFCRAYDGSAIDDSHTIYGTATHTFAVTECVIAE